MSHSVNANKVQCPADDNQITRWKHNPQGGGEVCTNGKGAHTETVRLPGDLSLFRLDYRYASDLLGYFIVLKIFL